MQRCSLKTYYAIVLVLAASALIIHYLLPSSKETNNRQNSKFNKEKCLNGIFQGISTDAGLGNVLFELMTFIAIAQITRRIPIITDEKTRNRIDELEHNLPFLHSYLKESNQNQDRCVKFSKTVETSKNCCIYEKNLLKRVWEIKDQTVQLHGYFTQSFKYCTILPQKFVKHLLRGSENVIRKLNYLFPPEVLDKDNTKICVHLRRGDFVTSPLVLPSSEEFTVAAVNYVKSFNQAATILVFSNEPNVTMSYFESFDNVYHAEFNRRRPANVEWEFSRRHCNVVIMTASVSTYGWWMAYLSKGQKVYYNKEFSKPGGMETMLRPQDFWLPVWIPLRYNKLTGTVSEEPW